MAKERRLTEMLAPVAEALGYELLGVEFMPQGRHSLLRIYIDGPDGVTVDDCAKVSEQVSAVLDVEDPIQGEFTLEVSSPGLDRPLFTQAHFEAVVGKMVQVRLAFPVEGRRKFKGRLLAVEEGQLSVEVDGKSYALPVDQVDKANLVHEW